VFYKKCKCSEKLVGIQEGMVIPVAENLSRETGYVPAGQPAIPFQHRMRKILHSYWLLPLVLFVMVSLGAQAGLFERLEMSLYDTWFRLAGSRDPGDRVVIVAIDEVSIREIGPLPWRRSVHARLLERLRDARVVGFDLIFDVPTKPAEDRALAEAVAKHGRVVLGSQFQFERDPAGEPLQVFQGPLEEITSGAAGIGFINMPTDTDGVVRHITAVDVNGFEAPFPCFGLAVALNATGSDPVQLKLSPGRLIAGKRKIPVDRLNRAMPCFWGPQGTFKTYSYADVLNGKIPAAVLRDKIVLVGVTSPVEKDDFPTPYTTSNLILSGSLPSPGVEIHASVVQSFLDGLWYRRLPWAANLGFLFLVGLVTTVVVARRGPWQGLVGALGVVLAAFTLVFILWRFENLWLNLAAPLTLVFFTYAGVTAFDFIQAELGRRRTRAMFSRYVYPAVIDQLMQNPDIMQLGGQRRSVTIMFCDIRGFTAYSENKAPEHVVDRLNQYLTAMTHAVFRHWGTLDKYLGDGLMAFFGAPFNYPDHVERAIRTAIDMQKDVEELNRVWAEKNEPPLKIGIGINSGSVLVGNIGSPERVDYTAIGEDVNLASRMEGLTKAFNSLIVISERSVKMLAESGGSFPDLRYLGCAEVKGFSEPVGVYTVGDYRIEKEVDIVGRKEYSSTIADN